MTNARYSYALKHEVEGFVRTLARCPAGVYVPNGVALLAAMSQGLNVIREPESPNGWIGVGRVIWITRSTLDALDALTAASAPPEAGNLPGEHRKAAEFYIGRTGRYRMGRGLPALALRPVRAAA